MAWWDIDWNPAHSSLATGAGLPWGPTPTSSSSTGKSPFSFIMTSSPTGDIPGHKYIGPNNLTPPSGSLFSGLGQNWLKQQPPGTAAPATTWTPPSGSLFSGLGQNVWGPQAEYKGPTNLPQNSNWYSPMLARQRGYQQSGPGLENTLKDLWWFKKNILGGF